MDTAGVIQLCILVVLIMLSAFFSSAETALTTLSLVKVRSMAEENPTKKVLTLQKILDKKSKLISAILIGNNIVNISASSLMTSLVIRIWGNAAVGIATGVLTLLILLFGEIVPKTWAMYNNENLALAYSSPIYFLMQVLTPIIFIIDKLSGFLLKLLHIDSSKRAMMTETELKTYVDVSHEDGVIEQEEKKLIYNVFDFSDSVAKDIMIPRIDMTTIDVEASYNELLTLFKESMYTRIPVYEDDSDNIIGIINVKDFLLVSNKRMFKIRDIMREAYYTYEYKKTADLLLEMRNITANVALVLNEYGATVGMITLEDLLEEIVGEIRDEYDEDEDELIQQVDDHTYLVDASMKLSDINDAIGTSFDSEDFDSIGGIIIGLLDRFPSQGETVTTEDGGRTASCRVTVKSKVVNVESVSLNKSSVAIIAGESVTLVVTVSPSNATNKNVSWHSSDESVATVSNGRVTALKAGSAVITVTAEDGGKTAICQVSVKPKIVNVQSVSLNKSSITLTEGESTTLTAVVSPSNATNKNVRWSSSDASVASVVNGKVTALKAGSSTIKVTTEDGGLTASCQVVVKSKEIRVKSVSLNRETLALEPWERATLTATVSPSNATNKNVWWSSSDATIVSVDNGRLYARKLGRTTITVTTEDGRHKASCQVVVENIGEGSHEGIGEKEW